jgi:glutamate/tyrosine decarboxylase-like PLP-dependent enzyme
MPSGSTESNMQALYFAREHFVGYDHVAVFYTERTHSALTKSLYYLKL